MTSADSDPSAQPPAPVTVIGLGKMGSALAKTFVARGHPTTVWNRTSEKANSLERDGATVATSPEEAVGASPVVVVCLSNYNAIYEALEPLDGGALSGRSLVNFTSGTPEEARTMAAWASEKNALYIDGALMAIPQAIGLAETLVFYGGSQPAFEAEEQTLRALGGNAVFVGADPGLALLYDLALLGMLWTSTAGYLHALALIGSVGVEPEQFLPFAQAWTEQVLLADLGETAREVSSRDYSTDVSSLNVNRAALDHLIKAGEAAAISNKIMRPIQELFDRQVASGHGELSMSSVIELLTDSELVER